MGTSVSPCPVHGVAHWALAVRSDACEGKRKRCTVRGSGVSFRESPLRAWREGGGHAHERRMTARGRWHVCVGGCAARTFALPRGVCLSRRHLFKGAVPELTVLADG